MVHANSERASWKRVCSTSSSDPGDFPDDATKTRVDPDVYDIRSGPDLAERDPRGLRGKECLPWESMTGFVAEFQREFYPISADEDALVVLEGSSYFQKSGELVDS